MRDSENESNATAIVAAHNALPALLDRIGALEGALKEISAIAVRDHSLLSDAVSDIAHQALRLDPRP